MTQTQFAFADLREDVRERCQRLLEGEIGKHCQSAARMVETNKRQGFPVAHPLAPVTVTDSRQPDEQLAVVNVGAVSGVPS